MDVYKAYCDRAVSDAKEIVSLIDELAPRWGIPTERLARIVLSCVDDLSANEALSCLVEIDELLAELATLGISAFQYWSTVDCDDEDAPLAMIAYDLERIRDELESAGSLAAAIREVAEPALPEPKGRIH